MCIRAYTRAHRKDAIIIRFCIFPRLFKSHDFWHTGNVGAELFTYLTRSRRTVSGYAAEAIIQVVL